jgi:hypothetical protein
MSKFNKDISLWLANGKETKTFYAFNGLAEKKAIEGLINRMVLPLKYEFPIARIFIKTEIKHAFVQGIEVDHINKQLRWYGADISDYKIKLILKDNTFVGPFYSNSLIADKKNQMDELINYYCNNIYKNNFDSAIVIDVKSETIVSSFTARMQK